MMAQDIHFRAIKIIFNDAFYIDLFDMDKSDLNEINAEINMFDELIVSLSPTLMYKKNIRNNKACIALIRSDEYLERLGVTKESLVDYLSTF